MEKSIIDREGKFGDIENRIENNKLLTDRRLLTASSQICIPQDSETSM